MIPRYRVCVRNFVGPSCLLNGVKCPQLTQQRPWACKANKKGQVSWWFDGGIMQSSELRIGTVLFTLLVLVEDRSYPATGQVNRSIRRTLPPQHDR